MRRRFSINVNPVEPEEMAYRNDLDIQASLQMIWEGAPLSPMDMEKEESAPQTWPLQL
ncbi:hypothetical protein [Psychrobacillus antarcticus]|uniref:hypothetical protein n=1 Tax=Psychrobacillus antarcticus TaxID=2879115 RepID=UPI00240823BC|nr:hypothetical protein [Psychrobacillus antarcticus]